MKNSRAKAGLLALPLAAALSLPVFATTSAQAASQAKCSKKSISQALDGDMVDSKLCRKGFAGGSASNPDFDYSYLLMKVEKKSGKVVWKDVKKRYCTEKKMKQVPKKVRKVSCDVS